MSCVWKVNGEQLLLVSHEREISLSLQTASEREVIFNRRPFGHTGFLQYRFALNEHNGMARQQYFIGSLDLQRPEYLAMANLANALMLALRRDESPGPSIRFYDHLLKIITFGDDFIEYGSNKLRKRFTWLRESAEACFSSESPARAFDPRFPLLTLILMNAVPKEYLQLEMAV